MFDPLKLLPPRLVTVPPSNRRLSKSINSAAFAWLLVPSTATNARPATSIPEKLFFIRVISPLPSSIECRGASQLSSTVRGGLRRPLCHREQHCCHPSMLI